METVADELVQSVAAPLRDVLVELPEEAVIPASESELGTLYQCSGYEIVLQTLPAGDLGKSIQTLSGYDRDSVTVMHTETGDWTRYDFVWACAGEQGEQIGRAVILDDGNYHYALSVLADAEQAGALEDTLAPMFASFTLS